MARKRKAAANAQAAPRPLAPGASPAAAPVAAPPPAAWLPAEATRDDWTVPLLALMMFLAPALGVPHELMLQDTLKSVVVSFLALGAGLLLLFRVRARTEPLRWHAIAWLPLLLLAYALGSMAWSHTYLAGVEAVRWFVFTLVLWLALNTLDRDRLPLLALGIHAGAVVASFWAALQFWAGFDLFPQGPNPASTFINRNFFAEYVVCTLPFGAMLLARARRAATIVPMAASLGLVVTAILMTGTRAALIALWLQLLVVGPVIVGRLGRQLPCADWPLRLRVLAPAVLVGTVLLLGVLPSSNPRILEEERGSNALERGMRRTQSIGPQDQSLGLRMVMWRATLRAIQAKPLQGLGAGAWESEIPLYQAEGSQIETDYYVHNEFLQLVAEYGVVGWAFLLALTAYLLRATWRTWQARAGPERDEAPWRAILLASLLALMVVSNIGFPWRMATTGALFALLLGGLAASDARLGDARRWLAMPLRWSPTIARAGLAAGVAALGLAIYITQRAAESEQKIVQATKMALAITAAGQPEDPKWRTSKRELLELVREGIALNPHYRKITPMVADELARWGDWENARWIWESVLASRPYVVAIISNTARAYAQAGDNAKALARLEQAKRISPRAPSVRSLEVILLSRAGREDAALALAKDSVAGGIYDYDMVNALYVLSSRAQDFPTAERAALLRIREFPEQRAGGYLQLGNVYAGLKDAARAQQAFNQAVASARGNELSAVLASVPVDFRPNLEMPTGRTPAASVSAHTSSTSR